MAFPYYSPMNYPNYYNPNAYLQQMQNQQMAQAAQAAQAAQQTQPTIQQSGFVLVQSEQILCMLAMSTCILLAAARSRKGWPGIAVPIVLLLLVIGINIALQFGLDDKLTGLIDALPLGDGAKEWMKMHPKDWCYPGMILTDIGMVIMELVLTRRQMNKTRHAAKEA